MGRRNIICRTATSPNHQTISKMKRISQLPVSLRSTQLYSSRTCSIFAQRCLHTSTPLPATVGGMTASGPPPPPPSASAEHIESRVARRRKQAELLKRGQDIRAIQAGTGSGSAKTKRFWKHVHVKHAPGTYSHFPSLRSELRIYANECQLNRRSPNPSRHPPPPAP